MNPPSPTLLMALRARLDVLNKGLQAEPALRHERTHILRLLMVYKT